MWRSRVDLELPAGCAPNFRDGRCIFRIKYWRLIGSSCPLLATLLSRSSAARRDDTLVSHTSPLHACERLSMKRHIAVLLAGLLGSCGGGGVGSSTGASASG